MSLEQITELFKWMTMLNVSFLILSFLLVMLLKNIIFKLHAKLFSITEEKVAVATYGYLGMYRLFVIFFNIVPYIALIIIE